MHRVPMFNFRKLQSTLASNLVEIFIDDVAIKVPRTATLIQACSLAKKEIPRFCYHERLAIAGNCRMCLVQVEKVPKPVASCAYPITANMKVYTDTDMVKKAMMQWRRRKKVSHSCC